MRAGAVLFFFVAIVSTGCVDVPDYESTPRITFNSIEKISFVDTSGVKIDSVVVTIDFQDGDGDLGVDAATREDTITYPDWGNYKMTTYRLRRVGTQVVEEEYPMPGNERLFFPILKPDGKRGPIKGKLSLSQIFYNSASTEVGYIRFRISIRDRNMNVSNEEPTDTIGVWVNR